MPARLNRIAPVDLPLTDEQAQLMGKLIPQGMPAPNLFRVTARNAGLFKFIVDTQTIGPTGLMDRRTLPPLLREAIILRTCVANRCDYEFNLHVQTISERMGLSQDQINDIKNVRCNTTMWQPELLAVFALVDSLVTCREVPDEIFAGVKKHFDDAVLIDITNLVGMYTGVAMMAALAQPDFDLYKFPQPILAQHALKAKDE
jgi:4-carboxymuconolactone decarboxylase